MSFTAYMKGLGQNISTLGDQQNIVIHNILVSEKIIFILNPICRQHVSHNIGLLTTLFILWDFSLPVFSRPKVVTFVTIGRLSWWGGVKTSFPFPFVDLKHWFLCNLFYCRVIWWYTCFVGTFCCLPTDARVLSVLYLERNLNIRTW